MRFSLSFSEFWKRSVEREFPATAAGTKAEGD